MTVNEERFFKAIAKMLRASEAQTNEALSLIDHSKEFMQECISAFLAVGCTLEEPTHQTCTSCNETKQMAEFARHSNRYNDRCRVCMEKSRNRRPRTSSLHNCVGPECTRSAIVNTELGYVCDAHYQQAKKHGELKALKKKRKNRQATDTHRECTSCKQLKANEEFYLLKDGRLSSACKECAPGYAVYGGSDLHELVLPSTSTCFAYSEGEPLIAGWLAKRFG